MMMVWRPGPAHRLALASLTLACTNAPRTMVDTLSGSATEVATTDATDEAGTATSSSETDTDTAGGPCWMDQDCVAQGLGYCDVNSGQCWPECTPESTRSCYGGPESTADVGACRSGMQTCNEVGNWGLDCTGEVLPTFDDCDANGADDDCDGLVDDSDNDGDGYGACTGGDCCDVEGGGCSDAHLVNPGAYEVEGNRLDDDCDGEIDEVEPECDQGLSSSTNDAMDFARAMDLCAVAVQNPSDPSERTWGVIRSNLSLADGSGAPLPAQRSVRQDFGDIISPERGAAMALLSSGHAADESDTNPAFAPFEPGQDLGTDVDAPSDWLAANGGTFPNPAGCLEPWNTEAHDSAMLTLRVRAPTNARSFSVMTFFLSAEYPEWVCSEFNDFFVALIDSDADNPDDGNIAIYDDDGTPWPLGVNLVMVADGLFSQCENGEVGCERDLGGNYAGCLGTAQLAGTGFDLFDPDICEASQDHVGGGTGWLRMSGNVTPGEVFEIRFAIWDTSGHIYDSLVILDDWQWSLDAAEPGVAPG
jgi:hypothetical protein